FAEASSEKPGILPIPSQTHDKPRWTAMTASFMALKSCRRNLSTNHKPPYPEDFAAFIT
ncbi:MAG: hypothetical protein ACI92S_003624, partial [Planctomycetaceae bacterium]